jgi:hypothetical protein
MCGYSYVTKSSADSPRPAPQATWVETKLSIGSGFRFGLGFMTAVVVFWLIFLVFWIVLFGTLAGLLVRG